MIRGLRPGLLHAPGGHRRRACRPLRRARPPPWPGTGPVPRHPAAGCPRRRAHGPAAPAVRGHQTSRPGARAAPAQRRGAPHRPGPGSPGAACPAATRAGRGCTGCRRPLSASQNRRTLPAPAGPGGLTGQRCLHGKPVCQASPAACHAVRIEWIALRPAAPPGRLRRPAGATAWAGSGPANPSAPAGVAVRQPGASAAGRGRYSWRA